MVYELFSNKNENLITIFESLSFLFLSQLKSLKKIEKKLSPGKDTEPYLTAGLNLVTYLRTPGYGNLQIFGGARAGTNTISFGYSNDGPTADKEGRGENPRPIFRIQPKITIDGSL